MRKVGIIGSGNWGSAISIVIGTNVVKNKSFDNTVKMYVHEENIGGEKLSEIINNKHENVKYLPGIKIPSNIMAVPDLKSTVCDADILVWVMPHQFLQGLCASAKPHVKSNVINVSLIKGFSAGNGEISFFSDLIKQILGSECYCLMGANLANEVATSLFAESTIGCDHPQNGELLKLLFQTPNFKINVVSDRIAVELCGALKNLVALGAGFADGLKYGGNTKAAIIRIGLTEIIKFVKIFGGGHKTEVFLESCGIADLVTTCYGGRNRTASEKFVLTGKTFTEIEEEFMNGQKLPGPQVAREVHEYLANEEKLDEFPLFNIIYKISIKSAKPEELVDTLQKM